MVTENGLCQCGCGQLTTIHTQNDKAKGWVKGTHRKFVNGHQHKKNHRFEVDPVTGCWNWVLSCTRDGYAHGVVNGKVARIHRVHYVERFGPIPANCEIDHLCKNRRCVNPDHLQAVPHFINVQRSRKTKLTAEQVREIRELYKTKTVKQLMAQFGMSSGGIGKIVNGQNWKKEAVCQQQSLCH